MGKRLQMPVQPINTTGEASAAADAGRDFIIVQGIEAGGHVCGRIGLLTLLTEVLDIAEVPVLAAGGIGIGRDMAAVLAAGASGVLVGTRFVCAEEARAHPNYVESLVAAEAKDTILTEAYSVGWPNAPHRVLRKRVEAAEAFRGEIAGEVQPLHSDKRVPLRHFQPQTVTKRVTGAIEALPQWAGESVGGVKRAQTAAEIIGELTGEAEKLLKRWH